MRVPLLALSSAAALFTPQPRCCQSSKESYPPTSNPLLLVSPQTWAFQITTTAGVPPLLVLRRWSPPAWHLRARTALLLSLDAAQVLPDPKNVLSPLFFAGRAMSMDYWHISFIPHSGDIATSTRSLGMERMRLGCSVAGSPGTNCLHGEVRKGSFQCVCLYLTPMSIDECSSPPGTAEKQWYFRGGTRKEVQYMERK